MIPADALQALITAVARWDGAENDADRLHAARELATAATVVIVRDGSAPTGEPSAMAVMDAIDVLSRTERYSVKDNDLEDWIA